VALTSRRHGCQVASSIVLRQVILGRPSVGCFGAEVLHQVCQSIGHSVELVLEGLLAALLGVLQERHKQEGDSYVPSEANTVLLAEALRIPVGLLLGHRELARMLSGKIDDASLAHASELLVSGR
jgi:hypothetical protein